MPDGRPSSLTHDALHDALAAPQTPSRPHAFGATDGLLLLMATIWGVNFSFVKYATQTLSPTTFTALRLLGAAITMTLVALVQRNGWPARRDVITLMLLGVIGNGVYQLFFANGVSRTRVADAALIIASAPAAIAIVAQLFGIERLSWRKAAGIALSIAGVAIVILASATVAHRQGTLVGTLCMVAAVTCWSFFTIGIRGFTMRMDPVQVNTFALLGGVASMIVVAPTVAATPWHTISWKVWGSVLYASAISMGIAYLFYMRGLRVLGPTRAAIYGNLQPLVAALVAWGVFGEIPTMWQCVGGVLIVGGILLTRW